jgi:hypothetical protein
MYPKNAFWLPYALELRNREPKSEISFRNRLGQAYGGMWQYNEVIGHIRLHFLGSQIRGEYIGVSRKRVVRTRRKIFEFQTWKLAPEIEVPADATSALIFGLIKNYVSACRRELSKRYIDTAMLDAVGPYIDLRRLYDDHIQRLQSKGVA